MSSLELSATQPAAKMKPAATKSPSTRHWTASNRLLWPVLEALRAMGHSPTQILKRAGVDERLADAPDGRVPLAGLFRVWTVGVEISGDPSIGARLAAFANPEAKVSWPMPLSLFEHIGITSKSLAEGVEAMGRYARLLRDGARVSLDIDGETACYRLELTPDEPPALVEHMYGVVLNLGRRIALRDLVPKEIWFSHAAPPDTRIQTALFRAPVRYGAPFSGIFGAANLFTDALPTSNEVINARVRGHADKLLLELPNVEQFEDTVCAQIERELPDGNTNSASVAEKLGVSGRTLHRRLHERGTTYQELLDRVRLRLATRFLASGRPIGEVAASVGFSQASTFHRAFKSWTGQTPTEYQQRCNDARES